MKISKAARKKINFSRVQARLMLAFDVSDRAVRYWFKHNSDKLTTITAMKIMKEESGLTEEQIFTEI